MRGTTLWLTADPAPPPPPKPVAPPVVVAPRPAPPVAVPPRPMPVEPDEPPVRKVREITLGKAPPSCTQLEEQVKACSATEYKNGLLSAQVVELEEKVRQLQLIVDGKSGAAGAASAASADASAHGSADASAVAKAAAAVAAASAAKPSLPFRRHRPRRSSMPKRAAASPGCWWAASSASLAAAGGGAFFVLKRRKAARMDGAPAAESFFSRLAGRFKRKPTAALDA
ncbi:hypothetical protein LP420_08865 [Massilia sp. B-10]|nr:hypothetical protein LP420_08865 [Massilia sp. B-10]